MNIDIKKARQQLEESKKAEYLNSPCTIAEAVQIARGVAEDVLTDYMNRVKHMQISMSLQIEVMKDILITSGVCSEEKFHEKYLQQVEIFNKMQQEALGQMNNAETQNKSTDEDESPQMVMSAPDIESTKEE